MSGEIDGIGARSGTEGEVRRQLLSVVVPCANEESVLPETHRQLIAALTKNAAISFEIIYVDDGSTDATAHVLRGLQRSDARVRVIRLSRNFGHQVAITAGMEHAAGDAVVLIDADLQDPPEVIAAFVEQWQKGYAVAYGVRTERRGETALKLWTAKVFYRLISRMSNTKIPLDTGDFRLMDREVVDALLAMPERDRFIRGMVSWLGFSQIGVPYCRAARVAGKTKFSLYKMVRFATDGIVSFSTTPLKLASYLGFAVSGVSIIGILIALYARLFGKDWVQGWTSLVIAVLFLGGVQLVCLGIIGEYVGRTYGESKRRPLYLVQERLGFEKGKSYSRAAQQDDGFEGRAPLEPLRFPMERSARATTGKDEASQTEWMLRRGSKR